MEKTTSYQDANMSTPFFLDKNFEGLSDQFFDDALGYFDFPLEDVEPNDVGAEDWQAKFEHLEPPPCDMLVGFSSGFCGGNINESLKARKSSSLVLHDEPSQLKPWLGPAQASSGRSIPLDCHSSEVKYSQVFRTTSPVSVLESSGSSCSAENATCYPKLVTPVKRPRSKHPRTRRCTFQFVAAFSAPKRFHCLAASDPELESCDDEEILNSAKGRRKKRNTIRLSSTEDIGTEMKEQGETRKCTHCEVTKTPQWREGPMGPKTLCNACGVRYRSGRLLPEYRPAASPTFVPFLHSNSHRKVLEMRKQTPQVTPIATTDVLVPTAPAHLF